MSLPIIDRLEARGAVRLDLPLLQPAEPFLELAGEDLRRRVFLAEDVRGRLRCLRPELTIPAARAHIEAGRRGPVRYALAGTVFRQRDGADEFPQAGIETIGGPSAEEDARALTDAIVLVDDLAPTRRAEVVVGDRAIYRAALHAIGLPDAWLARLMRVHGDPNGSDAAFPDHAQRSAPEVGFGADPSLPDDLDDALKRNDRVGVEAAIAAAIIRTRMGKGVRTPAEVAARLLERHELSGPGPTDAQRSTVRSLSDLACPFDAVPESLAAVGLDPGSLSDPLDQHRKRIDALRGSGVDPAALTFRAGLGRPLDYYTGLIFEIRDAAGTVLAAGGRYDRLLGLLGGAEEPAVGFALWLDRLGVNLDGSAR